MFKIHTSDGRTIGVDPSDPEQAREWVERLERPSFQASITGVTLIERHDVSGRCPECDQRVSLRTGVQYSMSRPQGFRHVNFGVESIEPDGKVKGSDRLVLLANELRLVLTAHHSQPSARVTLAGWRRQYAPQSDHRQR